MVYNCINNIRYVLFPPHCMLCGESGRAEMDLCQPCLDELPANRHRCSRCALPLSIEHKEILCGECQKSPPLFEHCLAPYRFEGAISELINGFKFHAKLANGRLLSTLLADAIESHSMDLPELIIPVPLPSRRLKERGYNQALELARPIAKQFQIPINYKLIRRVRNTPAQSGLNRKKRQTNTRGAFELTQEIKQRHVVLIDDVVTTGSTVEELTKLLKKAGVQRVDIWAVARTGMT